MSLLVQADRACDYIPVLSTVTNLIDLFQKCCCSCEPKPKDHYYKHIQDKSVLRCITLLIPVVGNLIVALYDACSVPSDRQKLLAAINRDAAVFQRSTSPLKHERQFILDAVRANPAVVRYLQGIDEEIALLAVSIDGMVLEWIPEQIQSTDRDRDGIEISRALDYRKVVLKAVKQNGLAYAYAGNLQNNAEVLEAAVRQNAGAYYYASEDWKRTRARVKEVVGWNWQAFQHAHVNRRKEVAFVRELVKIEQRVVNFAAQAVKRALGASQ